MKKSRWMPRRPVAKILTIGDELLKGTVLNTNARFLGAELLRLGFKVESQVSCPDDLLSIKAEFSRALAGAELILVTGGLGPTPDDVTRDAAADFFKVPLVLSNRQLSFIQNYYKSRGKKMPPLVRKEALFPQNAEPLFNRYGIALGFSIAAGERLMVILPGVPDEMEKMFRELVAPLVLKKFKGLKKRLALIVKTVGISEPGIMEKLKDDFFDDPFEFGIYPMTGEVTLRFYTDSFAVKRRLEKKAAGRLKKWIYAREETTLAAQIGKIFLREKKTLAVAESCTGGLLASGITAVPGASRYFKGGITAYENKIKENWLAVPPEVLRKKGAVSPETALCMAAAVRLKMAASIGIGITGIAGPSGGSREKPVGLVYIAIVSANKRTVWKEIFRGTRDQIQARAAKKAFEYLWRRAAQKQL